MSVILQASATLFAFLSAAYWMRACHTKVPVELTKEQSDEWADGQRYATYYSGEIIAVDEKGKYFDVGETLLRQEKENGRAALFAGIAAVFFATDSFLPLLSRLWN